MEQTDVRLRAAKDDLADAVGWVARNLPTRPAQPILRGRVSSRPAATATWPMASVNSCGSMVPVAAGTDGRAG